MSPSPQIKDSIVNQIQNQVHVLDSNEDLNRENLNKDFKQTMKQSSKKTSLIHPITSLKEYKSQNLNLSEKSNTENEKKSQNYNPSHKRQKLPTFLRQALQKKAQQSKIQKKQQTQNVSSLGDALKSKVQRNRIICKICLTDVQKKYMVNLCACQHQFCMLCLHNYMIFKIKMYEEVICPQQKCDLVMSQDTVFYKNILPPYKKQYTKVHNFYITSNDPTLRLCPKENCDGIIKIIEGQARVCGTCKKEFCSECYFEKHEGNCVQLQVDFLQNNLHYRQCGRCKTVVQRISGCNHMTCKCRYQFCYQCGKRWTGLNHDCVVPRPRMTEYVGIFQPNGCCSSCNCCNKGCNEVCMTILRFPLRLLLTLFLTIFIVVVIPTTLSMILMYFIGTVVAGIVYYPFQIICDYCYGDKKLIGFALIIFIPLAIVMGLYRSFTVNFIPLARDDVINTFDFLRSDFLSIWC